MTRLIWSGNFVLGSLDHPEGVCGSKFSGFVLKEWGALRNFPVMIKVSWLDIFYSSERFWWRWSRYCRISFQTALATSPAVIQQWCHGWAVWMDTLHGNRRIYSVNAWQLQVSESSHRELQLRGVNQVVLPRSHLSKAVPNLSLLVLATMAYANIFSFFSSSLQWNEISQSCNSWRLGMRASMDERGSLQPSWHTQHFECPACASIDSQGWANLGNSFFPTLSVLHEQRSSLTFVNLSRIFPRQEVLCGNCSLTEKGRVALWESV